MGDQPEEEGRAEQGGDHADRQGPAERRGPHDQIGGEQQIAPISAAGTIARPGWPPVSRRAKIGATRPTKPIAPQIATQAPTPIAVRQTIHSRSRPTSWPSDCRDLLAKGQAVERPARSRSSSSDREQGRHRGEAGLGEAAVEQRAHQPVIGVVESEGGGGQRERKRGQRPGERADRKAGEQQGRGLRARPGQRDQQSTSAPSAPATAPSDKASGAEKPNR